MASDFDLEYGEGNIMEAFSDKAIRMGFIRKVYGILTVQMAITCGIISLFAFSEDVQQWTQENDWFYITALVGTFVTLIVLACIPGFRRKSPGNLICLILFTIFEGIMLGSLSASSLYTGTEVFTAMCVTAIIVLCLTIFAFQTKIDFTVLYAGLFVALMCLILFGITLAIFPSSKWLNMLYCGIGVFVFCLYIVFDTQIMLGGKHRYAISPEEYIFAALNLYLDIVNLFLLLLRMIGGGD